MGCWGREKCPSFLFLSPSAFSFFMHNHGDTCLSPNKNILSRTPQMIPNLRFTPINVEVSPLRNIYSALTVTCKVTEYKPVISGTEG